MLELDHITVAAASLAEGVAYAEEALGVPIPAGGAHALMATHNHLLRLGDGLFLEVIAPDPSVAPSRIRWFGLDDNALMGSLVESPRLVTWVARTASLAAALAAVEGSAGPPVRVQRGDLSWLISVSADGSMPFGGAFPTLIEWPPAPHPATRMEDRGCSLKRFTVEHPQGARIAELLSPHLDDSRITIQTGPTIRL